MSPISIKVNGQEWSDFKSAQVSYSLEQFARSFSLTFSDKWFRTGIRQLPFAEGDPCQIAVHGEVVLDGFIDDIPISYDANSHSITVAGRSWVGHMVDCSAVYQAGSWKQTTLEQIAKDVSAPFGVVAAVDPWASADAAPPFKKWAIEDEESAYECVQRAAKMRGLFLTAGAGRQFSITKASTIALPTTLQLGGNIKSAERSGRYRDRYASYTVKSQTAGNDTFFADLAGKGFFTVVDPGVTGYRPLIVVSDGQGTADELERRATWEMNVRAGRSRRVVYTVRGFRPDGIPKAWPINHLVAVNDPFLDTRETLLIVAVTLNYASPGGEVARLELGRAEAFDILRPPTRRARGGTLSIW